MAGELLPPPDLAPTVSPDVTHEECLERWIEVMNLCEAFLLAGLRREIGPDGDLQAAYREWRRKRREEKDAHTIEWVRALSRAAERSGG